MPGRKSIDINLEEVKRLLKLGNFNYNDYKNSALIYFALIRFAVIKKVKTKVKLQMSLKLVETQWEIF